MPTLTLSPRAKSIALFVSIAVNVLLVSAVATQALSDSSFTASVAFTLSSWAVNHSGVMTSVPPVWRNISINCTFSCAVRPPLPASVLCHQSRVCT